MTPDDTFDRFLDELSPQGATAGTMFGKRALKLRGKVFVCMKDEVFAFRLGAGTPNHHTAMEIPGAELFEPCEGKTFKDWVVVPESHSDSWHQLAEVALHRLMT
jgi:hypothetical protein